MVDLRVTLTRETPILIKNDTPEVFVGRIKLGLTQALNKQGLVLHRLHEYLVLLQTNHPQLEVLLVIDDEFDPETLTGELAYMDIGIGIVIRPSSIGAWMLSTASRNVH